MWVALNNILSVDKGYEEKVSLHKQLCLTYRIMCIAAVGKECWAVKQSSM